MGISIYYRSTEPVDADREAAIRSAAAEFNVARSWLSCEPLCFLEVEDDGLLVGDSKLNFDLSPLDAAAAEAENLPDGTVHDLLEALCAISRTHGVDWEVCHEYDPSPIGYVRHGVADDALVRAIDGLGEAAAFLIGEFEGEAAELGVADESPPGEALRDESDEDDDDDDEPRILKLFPD